VPLKNVGVAIGTLANPISHENPDDYGRWYHGLIQLRVPGHVYTCAVDVSTPRTLQVQYLQIDHLDETLFETVRNLSDGFHELLPTPASGALDILRSPLLPGAREPGRWTESSGQGALDRLARLVNNAARVYIYGQFYCDPDGRAGMHNVHMNQGDPPGEHQCDDGVWQDGGTIVCNPDGTHSAFLTKFSTQSFRTHDTTGLPLPPPMSRPEIVQWWNRRVSEFLTTPVFETDKPAVRERYRLYGWMLLALVGAYFNGNRFGGRGLYPWRERQRLGDGPAGSSERRRADAFQYQGDSYLGHNIAALAVDARGRVIDFDFNHNQVFSSSVEHAESRLVRRVFSLASAHDPSTWPVPGFAGWPSGAGIVSAPGMDRSTSTLPAVTIFTSLEPCAQCAGIMSLAKIKEVVFVQHDPGAYGIAAALYHLADAAGTPNVRPISAPDFDFEPGRRLNAAFERFAHGVSPEKPFYVDGDGQPITQPAVASFLCTDAARDEFSHAWDVLAAYELTDEPSFAPTVLDQRGQVIDQVLTNADLLVHLRAFLDHAVRLGNRGTPHRV
jgi:tRNA(Arg) A34 adenosine deaminase TadA